LYVSGDTGDMYLYVSGDTGNMYLYVSLVSLTDEGNE